MAFGWRSCLVLGITAVLLAAAGPAAAVPTLSAPSCIGYEGNVRNFDVSGSGFVPGSFVSVRYEAPSLGEPRSAALVTADGTGSFTAALVPPSPPTLRENNADFILSALDPLRPALFAARPFRVTRIRAGARPRASTDPGRRALFEARGFERGATVYAHFHPALSSRPERTIVMGRSRGPCGLVRKRMALVPGGDVARGSWSVDFDTERRFSPTTTPQATAAVLIRRRPPRR